MNRKAVTLDKSSYVRPAQRWGFSCWNIIWVEEEGEWLQCNSLLGLRIPCNGKLVSISFESWIFWKLTRPKYLFNGGFQYGDGGMTVWSLNIQNFSPHYEKCKTVLFSETVIMFIQPESYLRAQLFFKISMSLSCFSPYNMKIPQRSC